MNSTGKRASGGTSFGLYCRVQCALYNALCFYRELNGEATSERVENLIKAIEVSFPNTFVNGFNYLFDYVNGSLWIGSVRPNMIFAVALPYSPLTRMQRAQYWIL